MGDNASYMQQFGDIYPLLIENPDIGSSLRSKLLDILSNLTSLAQLKIELAAVVDVGEPFVKVTYALKGGGVLKINCFEKILKLRDVSSGRAYYPNLQSVAMSPGKGNEALKQQVIANGLNCVRPGLEYFHNILGDDTKPHVN